MAKTLVTSLGPAGTPQEVKRLRQSSFDLHQQIGSPVIFKHRWTQADVQAGRTTVCPYHDDLYGHRDSMWDTTCFGTGFTGGYADGQIVFVTLQDTQETQIKIGETGILTMDMHPAITAPWMPTLANGDLVIVADFDPSNWQVVEEYERYELRDVTPVTMRGPYWGRQKSNVTSRQIISQESQADKLPPEHPLYQVPIVFDYSKVPQPTTPPFDENPETGYAEFTAGIFVHGILPDDEPPAPEPGTETYTEYSIRIGGVATDAGTTISF